MNGFFLIDKERGMTSFDVVRQIRKLIGVKKVGHCGTLDPMATGLLLVAIGEGTKFLEYLVGLDKEYEVLARFGEVSDTYDAEGIIETVNDVKISRERIDKVIRSKFVGNIKQVPPKYSALKIKGKRACDIVRRGGDVELKPRDVVIYEFKIVEYDWPEVRFIVKCGSGTYIRSLIHDLGVEGTSEKPPSTALSENFDPHVSANTLRSKFPCRLVSDSFSEVPELGCGAYVKELERTMIGRFSLDGSIKLEGLTNKIDQYLISLEKFVLKNSDLFNLLYLSDADFLGLKDGKVLLNKRIDHKKACAAIYKDKVVGILENFMDKKGIKYAKVINCDKFLRFTNH